MLVNGALRRRFRVGGSLCVGQRHRYGRYDVRIALLRDERLQVYERAADLGETW